MKETLNHNAPVIWVTTLMFSITFLIAAIGVPVYGATQGFDPSQWLMMLATVALCGISVTAGYHRLWSHNAYTAHFLVRLFFAFWGTHSLQNSVLIWASGHRRHHRHIDNNDKDPYSIKRGFWFAHIGWMLRAYPSGEEDFSNVRDLKKDPIVAFQHKYYMLLALSSNILLPLVLGVIHGDIVGTMLLVGVLRIVITHHTTFFINSLAHMWGKQPYTNTNTAKDSPLVALITYGEGYHNFHHHFQTDYRNGVRWWQFDPTKWLICGLSWIGLASNLRRVPTFKIREAQIKMQFSQASQQLESSHLANLEAWKSSLEKEYDEFLATLSEWTSLRAEWYQTKRQSLQDALQDALQGKKGALQFKWEFAAVTTRFKEMEYSLKMQQKRLKLYTLNFQAAGLQMA
ncbi:acyl-CoA desaturase [Gammaproteobacteria bacterium 42_54_T18]|nr:acyl-CoA desaturase [Gammaproteobacteria bacterium 42_54_T18]